MYRCNKVIQLKIAKKYRIHMMWFLEFSTTKKIQTVKKTESVDLLLCTVNVKNSFAHYLN